MLELVLNISLQFEDPDEICGIVVSIRSHEDIIAVWTKHGASQDMKFKIK